MFVHCPLSRELGCEVGDRVGFKVRFQEESSAATQVVQGMAVIHTLSHCVLQVLYQTDGMLLREAMLDPELSR